MALLTHKMKCWTQPSFKYDSCISYISSEGQTLSDVFWLPCLFSDEEVSNDEEANSDDDENIDEEATSDEDGDNDEEMEDDEASMKVKTHFI